jgi:hypothetical protein
MTGPFQVPVISIDFSKDTLFPVNKQIGMGKGMFFTKKSATGS